MTTKLEFKHNNSRIFDQICHKLGWPRGGCQGIKKRARWSANGTPAVDSGDQNSYPVKTSDLAWDYGGSNAYICTVAPAAATNATFVKLHA